MSQCQARRPASSLTTCRLKNFVPLHSMLMNDLFSQKNVSRKFKINWTTRTQNSRIQTIETMLTKTSTPEPTAAEATLANSPKSDKPSPSWAEIVIRDVPEERRAEVINARKALKPRRRFKPITPKTKAEAETGVRIVYVDGIQRMRLRELKGFLKSLGFSISKIFSISYIGYATAEFILEEDYAPLFMNQIRTRTDATIAEDFEVIAATGKTNTTLDPKLACQRRLNRIRDRETTPLIVKNLIDRFIAEKGLERCVANAMEEDIMEDTSTNLIVAEEATATENIL